MTTKQQLVKDYKRWKTKRDEQPEWLCQIELARLCASASDWMLEKIRGES